MVASRRRDTGRGRRKTRRQGGDLHLRNVTKRFGTTGRGRPHPDDPRGSFFALLGPSGCGKTTTLRMVAGLEEPTEGSISSASGHHGPRPFKRPVNTVFQTYALFPHLDIFENVAFGLRRRGRKDVKQKVEALDLVELGHLARRKPAQLSGGQQQRIALARAVVNRPQVLLLDEPLGALDLKLRRQMQIELKRIQTEVGMTFVHVTHDQEEAMTMADTVAVMNAGRIEQLVLRPRSTRCRARTFVANFLGQSNLVAGRRSGVVRRRRARRGQRPDVRAAGPTALRRGTAARRRPAGEDDDPRCGGRRSASPSATTGSAGRHRRRASPASRPSTSCGRAWGQELTVFAQNLVVGDRSEVGDPVDPALGARAHLRAGRRERHHGGRGPRGPGARGGQRRR